MSVFITKYHSGDQIKKNEVDGARRTYGRREEVHTGFWWRDLREGDHGRPRRRWEDNIKIFKKWDGRVWTVLIWLRIGTGGGLL
jgi:hypothetical protein